MDRNIIIKLHKKGESNVSITKKLKMNRSTVWKMVKKFKEKGTTSDKLGQSQKRSVRTQRLPRNTWEKLHHNPHQSH